MQQKFGYTKGMRQSISPNKADPQSYYEALNKRVIVDSKSGTAALTDEPGTRLLATIPNTKAVYTVELDSLDVPVTSTITFYTGLGSTSITFNCPPDINLVYSTLNADSSIQLLVNAKVLYYGIKGNKITFVYLNDTSGGLTVTGSGLEVNTIVPQLTSPEIIATTVIRNWLVLFTRSGIYGQIWKCSYDDSGNIPTLNAADNLVYNNIMYPDTTADYQIYDVVGRWDNENLIKIYWSNTIDELQHINIASKESLILPVELLSITPDVELSQPKIEGVITGGLYNSGMVQYGYQLYNLYGAETVISPLSGLVHLTDTNDYSDTNISYKGADNGVMVGKAVKINIQNIDKRFDFIKVIAVYYTSEEGEPEVNVVADSNIPQSGNLTITDAGDTILSVYTPAQLNSIGTRVFSPKLLTTKDNFLIAGNYKDKYFDIDEELGYYWDARAYRFGPLSLGLSNTSKIKYVGGTDEWINNNFTISPNSDPIPETHDCYLSKEDQDIFKYQIGGQVLGGSGTKISYRFITRPLLIDDLSDPKYVKVSLTSTSRQQWGTFGSIDFIEDTYSNNNSYTNYSSAINQSEVVGYQRDEVYRFGIVFFDGKFRQSFVKWIADIKMPKITDEDDGIVYKSNQLSQTGGVKYYDTYFRCLGGTGIYANALGIEFSVNTEGLPKDWSYMIVRARREDVDKTIVAQGTVTVGMWNGFYKLIQGSNVYHINNLSAYDSDDRVRGLLYFYSPETKFNKNFSRTSGDKLKFLYSVAPEPIANIYPNTTEYWRSYKFPTGLRILSNNVKGITDTIQTSVGKDKVYTVNSGTDSIRFSNFMFLNDDGPPINLDDADFPYSFCGSNLAIGLEDKNPLGYSDNVIVNYERDLVSQYGGYSYIAKQITTYITAGKLRKCNNSFVSSRVYGGDTFIEIFDILASMLVRNGMSTFPHPIIKEDKHKSVIYIPVETTINLAMRQGTIISKNSFAADNPKVQETVVDGFQEWPDDDTYGAYPSNLTDYYIYNKVYSKQPTGKSYVGKPFNFSLIQNRDCDVTSSEKYISGEFIDSWTTFRFNNKITVNSANGQLSKLHVFRNQVMFWQDKAFGLFSFNDRKVITDTNGSQLILGVGSVLEYFQYLSEMSGTKYTRSVVDSGAAMYWYDNINKKLMMFQGGREESISDIADVAPIFKRSEFDNPHDIVGVFDKGTRRVLHTVKNELISVPGGYSGLTIGFNERLQAFESLYSYLPNLWVTYNGKLIGVDYLSPSSLYEFNDESNPNTFFGQPVEEGYITIVAGGDEKKVFTNVEFNSVSKNETTEYPLVTVDNMRLENSYSDSTKIPLTSANLRRRFRTWRIQLPKNIENSEKTVRYLDSYLKLTLFNTPNNNANLKLEDITIYYLIPIL